MKIITASQRTPEWRQARMGCITASNAYRAIGGKAARKTYLYELVAQELTGTPPNEFESKACAWGVECEPMALEFYRSRHPDLEVYCLGFVKHDVYERVGCSVDAMAKDRIIEIKCPYNSGNHVRHMEGHIDSKYVAQMQFCMWVTGKEECDFVSYDPRFSRSLRLYIKSIKTDEKIFEKFEKEIPKLQGKIDEILFEISTR